jgi:hypothetical protein
MAGEILITPAPFPPLILSEKGWDTFQALGDNAVLKGNLLFFTHSKIGVIPFSPF